MNKFKIEEVMLAEKCKYGKETADGHTVLIENGYVHGDKCSLNNYFVQKEI